MPTIIRRARTTKELNDVLELRYQAAVEAGREFSTLAQFTGRLLDHFDAYPGTVNIIATEDGKAIACLRAVEFHSDEALLNLGFDFREIAESLGNKCVLLDMLAIRKDIHIAATVKQQMFKVLLRQLSQKKADHALFACPVAILEICLQLGFKQLKDASMSTALGFDICPISINLEEFYTKYISEITDKEIIRFQEVFYSTIFEAGEILVMQGERGSTGYLIESGEVEVLVQREHDLVPISTIGEGHMVGEVAMVTNEPRTASLVAKTTTSCISFDRHEFMRLMYEHPQRSIDIFRIFSKRLTESNKKLAEMGR